MRVAVVGAGIMGASTALALAERGHQVTLFEQFGSGHELGSSQGRSRIIRKAYPDAFYTAIMDEGYGLWHELQRFSSSQIVFEPGLLYFGRFESENIRDVLEALQKLHVEHELLDHEQVSRIFPHLRMDPGEIGIFTPEAGWVDAAQAVRVSLERLKDLGGVLREGERFEVGHGPKDFDRYVLCPGAWITDFTDVPVRVTLQTFAYVEPIKSGPVEGPVWIDDDDPIFYGFPSEPGLRSVKIGLHGQGPVINPAEIERTPFPIHAEAIKREAERRFGAGDSRFTFTGCLYTSTLDEDFLFGRHGKRGYFVSACSGHGFKFGPWIGLKMADFVEEKDAPENHHRFCWPKPLLEA